MIKNPTLWIASFHLPASEKAVLQLIVSIHCTSGICRPGYRKLAQWISRDERTVGRALRSLKQRGLLFAKRRGKKLTNVYYIAHFLWKQLVCDERRRQPLPERRPPDRSTSYKRLSKETTDGKWQWLWGELDRLTQGT